MAGEAQLSTLDPMPRLYALQRDDDEEGTSAVVAWGLAFADGTAVTLWASPYLGAAIMISGSVRTVEERYAPLADAYLVWPKISASPGQRQGDREVEAWPWVV